MRESVQTLLDALGVLLIAAGLGSLVARVGGGEVGLVVAGVVVIAASILSDVVTAPKPPKHDAEEVD